MAPILWCIWSSRIIGAPSAGFQRPSPSGPGLQMAAARSNLGICGDRIACNFSYRVWLANRRLRATKLGTLFGRPFRRRSSADSCVASEVAGARARQRPGYTQRVAPSHTWAAREERAPVRAHDCTRPAPQRRRRQLVEHMTFHAHARLMASSIIVDAPLPDPACGDWRLDIFVEADDGLDISPLCTPATYLVTTFTPPCNSLTSTLQQPQTLLTATLNLATTLDLPHNTTVRLLYNDPRSTL